MAIFTAAAVFCAAAAFQLSRPALASSDLHRLPEHLADTGAFDPANRAFAPQYPLWSDGLAKKRSVYLPPGTAIDVSDPHDWTFPVGTRFWKEFSFKGRKVETRFLWKASERGWIPAVYVWNAEGTDATLAPAGGLPAFIELAPGKRHSIPSRDDCGACHGSIRPVPLGFTALQLSTDRDPNAIHGEPLQPGQVTLETLADEQRFSPAAPDFLTMPPRIKTADPATRAVLGYMVGNCSMCHNGRGEIAALAPVIRVRDLLTDADAVARTLIAPTRWQIPGVPDGKSLAVHPGEPTLSTLFVRMRSRSASSQMPPLGTVLRDQQAVDAVAAWIASRR